MTRLSRGAARPAALLALLLPCVGCSEGTNQAGPPGAPPGAAGGPPPGFPGPGMAGGMPGGGGPSTPIKEAMTKLAKGPNSLTETIGRELNDAQTPWDAIQPQAKEVAELTASLAQYDPPRGSKESWAKLTSAYAESASELDKAAQAKDKDAALLAHSELKNSCMACHREHRMMGPGMGGMGGPPGMGRGPGFGPPGGPGGPGGGPGGPGGGPGGPGGPGGAPPG